MVRPALISALMFMSLPGLAATLRVTTTVDEITDNSLCSLREAVISANSNQPFSGCVDDGSSGFGDDIIVLTTGLYTLDGFVVSAPESDAALGDLDIADAGTLTIVGAGPTKTRVDGNATSRLFDVAALANLTLQSLTLQNGKPSSSEGDGGAVSVQHLANLSLLDSLVRQNVARNGGGIHTGSFAHTIIKNSQFIANEATLIGGALRTTFGTITVEQSLFSGNVSGLDGAVAGAIGDAGSIVDPGFTATLEIRHSTLAANGDGEATLNLNDGGGSVVATLDHSVLINPGDEIYQYGNVGITRNHTLLDDASLTETGNRNINNANLSLDANFLPQPGSDALDAGDNGSVSEASDLAGNTRVVGTLDIGAFERPEFDCSGGIVYVDQDANAPGDGQSWASAWRSLHDALLASPPCEIRVAEGIYRPTRSLDQAVYLQIPDNVSLLGGYPTGGDTANNPRDWQVHPTIISGDLESDDVNQGGITMTTNDVQGINSHRLMELTDASVSLDGFVLTGAKGNTTTHRFGGAILAKYQSLLTLNDIRFAGNFSEWGGALNVNGSTLEGRNLIFEGNRANIGGAIETSSGNIQLDGAVFTGNGANQGSALAAILSETIEFNNVLMYANHTRYEGTLWANDSPVQLVNVTLAGNTGATAGVFNDTVSRPMTIDNTVIWNNTGGNLLSVTTKISHSLVEGCNPGNIWSCGALDNGGNLADGDPLFMDIAGGNFHPDHDSPLIDAGNDAVVASLTDLDGNSRISGVTVDIGTYEHQGYGVLALAGANGAITPPFMTARPNQSLQFEVTPNTGYRVAQVSGCGGKLAGTRYTTAPVTADCQIDVTFTAMATDIPLPDNRAIGGGGGGAIGAFWVGLIGLLLATRWGSHQQRRYLE